MSHSQRTDVWDRLRRELSEIGIDLDALGVDVERIAERWGGACKFVYVAPDIQESVDEMSRSPRHQVLMVRIDEETSDQLDAWVKTEAVKSRSEAAALFIREGLKVREAELEMLQDALAEVDRARERLHDRVREVFGDRRRGDA
ncbi:MAG: hypothetical protein R3190_09400 [Thermoanaerobaculia bacterium]|nr:hypothetical protein [Thermoanaerobaculia bacterium]